jgi:creatinine amidohydrolase
MIALDRVRLCDPPALRVLIGDGNYGGLYQRADSEMEAIWRVAVEETREMLEGPWS